MKTSEENSAKNSTNSIDEDLNLKNAALQYHSTFPIGQICTQISKTPNFNLGYTPGVANICSEIKKDPNNLYKYTYLNNNVAVISNGTAVLGLGNLGAGCSMPVMEGKCMIFKYYAGIDALPIVIDENDPIKLTEIIQKLQFSFGGINLEDIKAPDCFEIEKNLINSLNIPVFHDDQHGTAIVVCAGIINALKVAKKEPTKVKIVINGAGSAGIATAELLKSIGFKNIILCDTNGVIFEGRNIGMNEYKIKHATKIETLPIISKNTWNLEDVIVDSDIFIGLSSANVLSQKMIQSMAINPIVLALANPNPEILPHKALEIRGDVIIGTGRSDFPNQINNMLCFPYIFRASLDTKAKIITQNMKQAALFALADCINPTRDNFIPKIFTPYDQNFNCQNPILEKMTVAIVAVAMKEGVAEMNFDIETYKQKLIDRQTAIYKNMHKNGLI